MKTSIYLSLVNYDSYVVQVQGPLLLISPPFARAVLQNAHRLKTGIFSSTVPRSDTSALYFPDHPLVF